MIKWILRKLFPPPTPEQIKMRKNLDEMEAHGVRMVITDRGGWRLEFDNEEARRWYFNKSTKGFENFKI